MKYSSEMLQKIVILMKTLAIFIHFFISFHFNFMLCFVLSPNELPWSMHKMKSDKKTVGFSYCQILEYFVGTFHYAPTSYF